jgi:DNA-binding MarR family transcriptional regulator
VKGDPGQAEIAASFEQLADLMRRMTPADGLSSTTASTLGRLDREGPHRLSDLAAVERVTQPAMTQLVSRLERDGLAARGGDASDGRVVVVSITEGGKEAVRRRRVLRAERMAAHLACLSAGDRAAIVAALPALDRLGELITD